MARSNNFLRNAYSLVLATTLGCSGAIDMKEPDQERIGETTDICELQKTNIDSIMQCLADTYELLGKKNSYVHMAEGYFKGVEVTDSTTACYEYTACDPHYTCDEVQAKVKALLQPAAGNFVNTECFSGDDGICGVGFNMGTLSSDTIQVCVPALETEKQNFVRQFCEDDATPQFIVDNLFSAGTGFSLTLSCIDK